MKTSFSACLAWASALLLPWVVTAGDIRVELTVAATDVIYLAGQPDGTAYSGGIAPANSPQAIDLTGFDRTQPLRFTVSGQTSRDPGYPLVHADGELADFGDWWEGESFALSGLRSTFQSLVGVFLDSDEVHPIPPTLELVTDEQRAFTSLSPQLQQLFFIGDGLTGRGFGGTQLFEIPEGADFLYLGTFDIGHENNVGALSVTVTGKMKPSFRLNLPVLSAGTLTLSWSGGPGIKLQKTTSLTNPNWQDVSGSEGLSQIELPCADAAAFFRLIKP